MLAGRVASTCCLHILFSIRIIQMQNTAPLQLPQQIPVNAESAEAVRGEM